MGELTDHLVGHFVDQARRSGATWTDIGQSLGVTKQATGTPPPEHLPFAADSKRLLELSLREALLLGHNYIGTEHMLLAMLKDTGGTAGQLLVDLGMDGEKTQQWIVAELRGNSKP